MIAHIEQNLIDLVKQIVLGRIASDSLILPAMPESAARCLALARAPDINLAEVSAVIARDPMLAAQVLRVANSAALGGHGGGRSILAAVTRVGAERLRLLVVETAARRVFDSRDRRIATAFRGIWEHSLAVALVSRDVAIETAADVEDAYLAGLLHDIGKPVVAAMLLEAEKMVREGDSLAFMDHVAFIAAVQETHRAVGAAMARKWRMPDSVIDCVGGGDAYDRGDPGGAANLVRFSNALAKRAGVYVGDFDAARAEAVVMDGQALLGLDPGGVERWQRERLGRLQAEAA
jgi:putative nucleotidyltransferase with HDIG domain